MAFDYKFIIVDVIKKPGIPRGYVDVEEVFDGEFDDKGIYHPEWQGRGNLKPFHFRLYSSHPHEVSKQQKMDAISKFTNNDLTVIF